MSYKTEPGRVSAGIGLVRLIIVYAATLAGFWAASSVEHCGSRALSMAIVAVLAAFAVYGAIVRIMHPKVFGAIVFIIFGALFAVAGWSSSPTDQCLPGF
jgi:hypothetical protein